MWASRASFQTPTSHPWAQTDDAGPPFGALAIVDEVDCGNISDPHQLYEIETGVSEIQTIFGTPDAG
ncbi:MAG: hypothetical protein A2289_18460 [Deltaproteobacteria bacterium RIFOXYA12_FULL_58_15]|nr:MAG: hypothetical protein A2289_18460 [Deltaproteobacteria bacterium RIFOXYA12_FULL_58_15]OGR10593.1 MAG: hypothetical protein A2341_09590 [Deltaproteobacteria bacterium RIFOXYB12_FULL_58_9]